MKMAMVNSGLKGFTLTTLNYLCINQRNVLLSSFRFIWIHMWWEYGHYKYFTLSLRGWTLCTCKQPDPGFNSSNRPICSAKQITCIYTWHKNERNINLWILVIFRIIIKSEIYHTLTDIIVVDQSRWISRQPFVCWHFNQTIAGSCVFLRVETKKRPKSWWK